MTPTPTPPYYYSPPNQYQQPPQQMMAAPQPQNIDNSQTNCITLIKVPSIENVNAFAVPAGSSVSFMHSSKPYMFIKTAPSSPFEAPTLSIFKIVKVDSMDEDEASSSNSEYVTRTEYNELAKKLRSLEERISSNESVRRKPNKKWTDHSAANTNANAKREPIK